jgi:hypothetical protein
MIYAFVPLGDPSIARKVTASLAPQGRIVIETRLRTERHAQGKLAGLMGIVGPGELKTAFQHLDLLRYEEVDAEPDFGSGSAPLVRMIARLAERHM